MADKARHPVAQGGMWTAPKATYSPQTQQLLKDMMRESKLTNFQQRQLGRAMADGSTLPSSCHPTSSAKPRQPPQSRPPSKIVDPRQHSIRLRTKEDIEDAGEYEREQFRPTPQTKFRGFYEKDKERLANIMAYGEDIPPPNLKKAIKKVYPPQEPEMDRFDELVKEVEERKNFLKEMEDYGKAGQYKAIIETEVSQLLREMEIIDKKRTGELERMLASKER